MSRQLCIYVDVDDTFVRSVGNKRIPIPSVIRHIRDLHHGGALLYCWSSGGAEYAQQSAEEFGIALCFTAFLTKPQIVIDDVPIPTWPEFLHIHPASILSLSEYRTTLGMEPTTCDPTRNHPSARIDSMPAPFDFTQSLAELTGVDWGPPPALGGSLMHERHLLRRRPLAEWSDDELIKAFGVGGDEDILFALLMERVRRDSTNSTLVRSALSFHEHWKKATPAELAEIRRLSTECLSNLGEITDDLDRLSEEHTLYRCLWQFERALSTR